MTDQTWGYCDKEPQDEEIKVTVFTCLTWLVFHTMSTYTVIVLAEWLGIELNIEKFKNELNGSIGRALNYWSIYSLSVCLFVSAQTFSQSEAPISMQFSLDGFLRLAQNFQFMDVEFGPIFFFFWWDAKQRSWVKRLGGSYWLWLTPFFFSQITTLST